MVKRSMYENNGPSAYLRRREQLTTGLNKRPASDESLSDPFQ